MSAVSLTPEQELQARALAQRIRQAVEGDILQLARLLVSKPEEQIFGQTEFEVRDLVHRLGATALQTHLAGKKTRVANSAGGTCPPVA
jgi:F420-0:gamma-glutamyl ligase